MRGAAHKLANATEPAGIRLEVPDFLQHHFKALESIAYRIKRKHPNLKRNVKLDDALMDVVMDIKVSDGADWNTILPEHALAVVRDVPDTVRGGPSQTIGAAELSDLLGEDPGME